MNNNLIFKVKTIQSRVIKILIESLKDLLYEVNFIFSKEGISMNASNTSNTATICMKLMAENFEEFYCKQTKKVGISMKSLYNHIKCIHPYYQMVLLNEKTKLYQNFAFFGNIFNKLFKIIYIKKRNKIFFLLK